MGWRVLTHFQRPFSSRCSDLGPSNFGPCHPVLRCCTGHLEHNYFSSLSPQGAEQLWRVRRRWSESCEVCGTHCGASAELKCEQPFVFVRAGVKGGGLILFGQVLSAIMELLGENASRNDVYRVKYTNCMVILRYILSGVLCFNLIVIISRHVRVTCLGRFQDPY